MNWIKCLPSPLPLRHHRRVQNVYSASDPTRAVHHGEEMLSLEERV
ncbi:hypothetical protein [Paenibacillus sinensis]|nr:hypothetical protein [Paenibacillus sinensis]